MVFLFIVLDKFESETPPYSAVVKVPKAAEIEWILDLNEEENELVRSEFYYEQVRGRDSHLHKSSLVYPLGISKEGRQAGHDLLM